MGSLAGTYAVLIAASFWGEAEKPEMSLYALVDLHRL